MRDVRVSSADLQRQFGRYREAALREPIVITSHGRDSLVLLSAEEYRRLKQQDRQSLHAWELAEGDLRALEASEPAPECAEFDAECES